MRKERMAGSVLRLLRAVCAANKVLVDAVTHPCPRAARMHTAGRHRSGKARATAQHALLALC